MRASDTMLRRKTDYLAAPPRLRFPAVPRDLLIARVKPDENPFKWWMAIPLSFEVTGFLVYWGFRKLFGRMSK